LDLVKWLPLVILGVISKIDISGLLCLITRGHPDPCRVAAIYFCKVYSKVKTMNKSVQNPPTKEYLNSVLRYEPETGFLFWKVRASYRIPMGTKAGTLTWAGYTSITIGGKLRLAHRLIWCMVHGEFPPNDLDHINHDRNDNRIENLRLASRTENMKNQSVGSNNKSGVLGVRWHKRSGKWKVQIGIEGKSIHLGYFKDKSDAIKARMEANIEYGYHVNHGTVK
jgi:hypothetical protein